MIGPPPSGGPPESIRSPDLTPESGIPGLRPPKVTAASVSSSLPRCRPSLIILA